MPTKIQNKIRINIMIKPKTLKELDMQVENRERSSFIDQAIQSALLQLKRQEASTAIDAFREAQTPLKLSDEELKKMIRYGLE